MIETFEGLRDRFVWMYQTIQAALMVLQKKKRNGLGLISNVLGSYSVKNYSDKGILPGTKLEGKKMKLQYES